VLCVCLSTLCSPPDTCTCTHTEGSAIIHDLELSANGECRYARLHHDLRSTAHILDVSRVRFDLIFYVPCRLRVAGSQHSHVHGSFKIHNALLSEASAESLLDWEPGTRSVGRGVDGLRMYKRDLYVDFKDMEGDLLVCEWRFSLR